MTLYEIDERLAILEEYGVDENGEILSEEDFNAKLDEIQMDLRDKIINTMAFYKNLQAEITALKTEETNLAERRKTKERLSERLKKRINDYIVFKHTDEEGNIDTESLNKWKLDDPKVKLSYRKSDSVDVFDIKSLPKKYIKTKVEESPDKTAIKNDIKSGKKICVCRQRGNDKNDRFGKERDDTGARYLRQPIFALRTRCKQPSGS